MKVDRRLMASKRAEKKRLRVIAWPEVPEGWRVLVEDPNGGPAMPHPAGQPLPDGVEWYFVYDPKKKLDQGEWRRPGDYVGITLEDAKSGCERAAKWNRELKHPKWYGPTKEQYS